jgi:hypothetical protein
MVPQYCILGVIIAADAVDLAVGLIVVIIIGVMVSPAAAQQ